jgi:hypothetical protein
MHPKVNESFDHLKIFEKKQTKKLKQKVMPFMES